MRITCPNCGAQYEVDPRVIPDIGRDVQCSNCGHTWFQRPPSVVAASVRRVVEDPPVSPGPGDDLDDDLDDDADDGADGDLTDDPGRDRRGPSRDGAAPRPRAAAAFPPILEDDAEPDAAVASPPPSAAVAFGDPAGPGAAMPDTARTDTAPPDTAPPDTALLDTALPDTARPDTGLPVLDEASRALLREEAEREVQARAAERRPPVEVQGDFGLSTAPRPIQRTADLGPHDGDAGGSPVAMALAAAANRRDSLPDVDRVSAGLQIGRGPEADPDDPLPEGDGTAAGSGRRGFRGGFVVPLLAVIAATLVYVLAPMLADAVPSLRAPLAGYVDGVNALRSQIVGLLAQGMAALTGTGG